MLKILHNMNSSGVVVFSFSCREKTVLYGVFCFKVSLDEILGRILYDRFFLVYLHIEIKKYMEEGFEGWYEKLCKLLILRPRIPKPITGLHLASCWHLQQFSGIVGNY